MIAWRGWILGRRSSSFLAQSDTSFIAIPEIPAGLSDYCTCVGRFRNLLGNRPFHFIYVSVLGGQGKVGEETGRTVDRSPSLTVVQCYKLTIRRIVVDVNILYLRLVNTYSPMSLPPAISINGIWTQFVRYSCIRSDYLLSSFLFFFLLLSFLSFVFSSFNVIATPLLRFVSRNKNFRR